MERFMQSLFFDIFVQKSYSQNKQKSSIAFIKNY